MPTSNATAMRPLAILGGTFDPVHLGHLRAAWEAAEQLDAEVRLLPANLPPHRPPPVASAAQRVAMLRVALAGQDRLGLDLREIERPGPSWTVDTLIALRREVGPLRPLVLLIGADAYEGLTSWHRWHALFELAHIGVLTRPGPSTPLPNDLEVETAPRRAHEPAVLHSTPGGRVLAIAVTPLAISATRVRALLATGHTPRYLVPDALLADSELLASYRSGPIG